MSRVLVAHFDATLRGTISKTHQLHYATGPDPNEDRPAHVRAGSSLTFYRQKLAVIQDDAHFVAFFDPDSLEVTSIALPRGEQGLRQFDDLRGNKRFKLDLEAATTVPTDAGEGLLAIASGSSAARQSVTLITPEADGVQLIVKPLPAFYAALHAAIDFSGSELNVEGALYLDGHIRLFNRGNGADQPGRRAINASVDMRWSELAAHILDSVHKPVPQLRVITQYELGEIDGVRLTFTDATVHGQNVIYVATAEASPNAIEDGPVSGSAIGFIRGDDVRWGYLCDTDNQPLRAKVEGVCVHPTKPDRLFILVDRDDPQRAAELSEVILADSS